jgi:hypothetical protein
MADWMDQEIEIKEQTLTNGQVFALMRMTEALRDPIVFQSIFEMKHSFASGDYEYAGHVWSELTEDEQTALWVAPKYGGIFTTEERKIIKGGFKDGLN